MCDRAGTVITRSRAGSPSVLCLRLGHDQRVLTETGSALKLRVPGEGVTFKDSGTVTYVPDQEYETPSVMHGVHDRYSGPDAEALICTALT